MLGDEELTILLNYIFFFYRVLLTLTLNEEIDTEEESSEDELPQVAIRRCRYIRFNNWFSSFLEEGPQSSDDRWTKFFRMPRQTFLKLVENLEPLVFPYPQRESRNRRTDIRFLVGASIIRLARGSHYDTSGERFGFSKSTMNKWHPVVLKAIWTYLHHSLVMPSSEEALEELATSFQEYCGLPNCIGAIDGTHIPIDAPRRFHDFCSAFLYFSHFFFSFLLLFGSDSQKITEIGSSSFR